MRVSKLNSDGDWQFGFGNALYAQRTAAIKQKLEMRLKMFINDWFADVSAGSPWFEIFGQRNNRERLIRQIELITLETEGIATIDRLDPPDVSDRSATITMAVTDIFNVPIEIEGLEIV